MAEHALKEWAVICEALRDGAQVLVLRKGGIGEKRFELPHRRFYLLPTHAHQRPELVQPRWREAYERTLARRDEPDRLRLDLHADLVASHPVTDSAGLDELLPLHVLAADYARERLRWRRKHPLWALVLRVHRVEPAPELRLSPELGGCVSWVDLDASLPAPSRRVPVMDDAAFATAAARVRDALAGAGALDGAGVAPPMAAERAGAPR